LEFSRFVGPSTSDDDQVIENYSKQLMAGYDSSYASVQALLPGASDLVDLHDEEV
jgi:hypothetical protein